MKVWRLGSDSSKIDQGMLQEQAISRDMFPVRLSVWMQPAFRTVGIYMLSASLPHRLNMRTERPKGELHYVTTDALTAK